MQATPQQKRLIQINVPTRDIKEEFVQWATGDIKKTSCNDLSFEQANQILVKLGKTPHKAQFRATFDKNNTQHKYILSLCIQYGWSKRTARGAIADLDRLNEWMWSKLCPVQKPLKKMTTEETSKVIVALEGAMNWKYNKKTKK